MPNDIMLIAALLLPAAIITALRINAALVFLSLCLGHVLVQFVAKDTDSLIAFIAPKQGSVSESTLFLIMLFLPVVLTSVIMLFSITGKLRTALNFLPAAGVGALGVVLAVPLCTPGLQNAIYELSFWHQLTDARAMIIGASAFISLVFLWSQRRGGHTTHDKHRSGHH